MDSTIIAAIIGAIAAVGAALLAAVITYKVTRKQDQKRRNQDILDNFLKRLQGILITTDNVFKRLTRGFPSDLSLEERPSRIRQHFDALPDGDPRKDVWESHIAWLQDENSRALELIRRFYGQIATSKFKETSDEFILHAEGWQRVWEALSSREPIPSLIDVPTGLVADKFPTGFEQALSEEIAEIERRAG